MTRKFPAFLSFFIWPGRFYAPARLLFLGGWLLWLASCSAPRPAALRRAGPVSFQEAAPANTGAISIDSSDAIFMAAVRARMLGRTDEALSKYTLFASLRPEEPAAHYELSRLLAERNRMPEALAEAGKAVKADSLNKWMLRQYADLLAYNGQYTEAAGIYGAIAARERIPEESLARQALLYQKARQYAKAIAVLDRLAAYTGSDDETLILQRQQLYLSMNELGKAADEGRRLIQYYPQEPRYRLLLAELYESNDKDSLAAQAYQDAIERFPSEPSVQVAMVQYYLRKKDPARVEYYLEKTILNRNASLEERIGLLVPFIQFRSADSSSRRIAFELSRKLAEQQPLQPEAVSLYGELLAADGRIDDALAQYKKVIAADSLAFAPWQQLMYLYASRQQNDSLVAYSERAVRIFPREYMAYYLGSVGYMQTRNNPKAIEFLQKAIQYQPGNNDALLSEMLASLGDVYHTDSNYVASDSCYRAALALQPDNATALNNFSYYLSLRGTNLEEAEQMSAKSLKLRPGEATFLDTYGWILYKQGKYEEAKSYILQAIEANKDGGDPTLWEHLGDIEYRLGNKQEALQHWKTALSKGERSDSLQQKINEKKLHD